MFFVLFRKVTCVYKIITLNFPPLFIPQGEDNLKLQNFTDRILSSFVTGGTFPELYTYLLNAEEKKTKIVQKCIDIYFPNT